MSDYQTIIDVTPVEHKRENRANAQSASSAQQARTPYGAAQTNPFGNASASSPFGSSPFGSTYAQGAAGSAAYKSGSSVLGGIAQVIVGSGLVAIGVPMLILPGPGLLSIAGGFALAANGMRKIFA